MLQLTMKKKITKIKIIQFKIKIRIMTKREPQKVETKRSEPIYIHLSIHYADFVSFKFQIL